jgi:hypothetical protein
MGVPVYNGYFSSPRPLDLVTVSEGNRSALARIFENHRSGDRVDPAKILQRFAAPGGESLATGLFCQGDESILHDSNAVYADFITE